MFNSILLEYINYYFAYGLNITVNFIIIKFFLFFFKWVELTTNILEFKVSQDVVED